MYRTLKKHIKSIIPSKFLFRNELTFRLFYGILYIGKTHKCNVCNHSIRRFIAPHNLCPFCGSLPRNRRLWKLLYENNSIKGTVLHFSPSRSLYRKFNKNTAIDYYSSDFEDEFLADYQFDITNIKQPDETFDLIICYHVLEHIIDDTKAMNELYRVLNLKGEVYIQTPFKDGEIYEDYSITSHEKRKDHFGQEDHVRVYSVKALKHRLEHSGFKVSVISFNNLEKDLYLGLNTNETVLILTK